LESLIKFADVQQAHLERGSGYRVKHEQIWHKMTEVTVVSNIR